MAAGKMRGVISTSALEMGIDIGGLDVCVLVGYPGTMVTTWQRAGRVGRQGRDCLIVLVAGADALDQYFIKYPDEFFGRPLETAVMDPDNSYVVGRTCPCAAQELPLQIKGETFFDLEAHKAVLADLDRARPPAPVRRGRRLVRPGPLPPEGSEHPGRGRKLRHLPDRQEAAPGLTWTATGPSGNATPARSISTRPSPGRWSAWTWSGTTSGSTPWTQLFHPHPDGKRDGNPGDHGDPPGGGLYGPHRPPQGHRTHHVL